MCRSRRSLSIEHAAIPLTSHSVTNIFHSLTFHHFKVKFEIESETHDPTDAAIYVTHDTNKMVEEFMLLANSTVAEFVLERLPMHSVLR